MASRLGVGEEEKVFVTFNEHHALLEMKNGPNKLNVEFLEKLHRALDAVERNQETKFLVTVGKEKFYSNGLDLEHILNSNDEYKVKFSKLFDQLLVRLLTFPLPTVAAINGHAFAGGAFLALAHDYRVMRTRQGWFCLPEVHLKLQIPPALMALIKRKIPNSAAQIDAVLMGKRFTAEDALSTGIVQKVCNSTELLDVAAKLGQEAVARKVPDRNHLKTLKCDLYSDVLEAFGDIEGMTIDRQELQELNKAASKL